MIEDFWFGLLTHAAAFFAGVFITRNPEKVKGWVAAGFDRLKRKPRPERVEPKV